MGVAVGVTVGVRVGVGVIVAVGVTVGVTFGSRVAVGVGVGDGAGQLLTAYLTALAAFTIAPVVVYRDSEEVLTPEESIAVFTSLIDNVEHADWTSAATPATWGDAIEVPDLELNPFERTVL